MISKKKSNKGFSLIELLGAIVVVALLAVITIASISRFLDKARKQKVVQNKQNVTMAAELYLQANRDLLPKMVGETTYIPIMDLRNSNYIKEDLTNEKGEDCMKESFVRVFKLAEGDYNYTTYLYCGNEKSPKDPEPPKPYLVDYQDDNKTVKVLFSNKDDVKKANFSFKLRGSQSDDTIGIYSYSYSILAKTSTNNTYSEVYNSGTIEANRNPTIEFRSRSLSSYVDLSGVTSIQIKITALNEQGGFLSYETDALNAGGITEYVDTVPPICPSVDDESGRQGEPKSIDSWINKNDIGTNKYPRAITLKCEDGDGSGCKRDTFTESWPSEEKAPVGAMFGEILLEDNSVIDERGHRKEANSTPCSVAVLVDLQAPSIDMDIINPSPAEGSTSNAAKNVEYHGQKITSDTIHIKDQDVAVKGNLEDTTLTIMPNNYIDSYTEHTGVEMEYWLNDVYYPEGVEYHVTIKDNLYLYRYTWEVNRPFQNLDSSDYENVSVHNTGGVEWNRLTDDELGLDENQLFHDRRNLAPEENVKSFVIGFKEEGARYGVLTVYDRAGNTSQIVIRANLDRTEPNIEEKISNIIEYEKALSELANSDEYVTNGEGHRVSKHPNLGFENYNGYDFGGENKLLIRKTQEELDAEYEKQINVKTPANTPSSITLIDIYNENSDMSGLNRCDNTRYQYEEYDPEFSVFDCSEDADPAYAEPPEVCKDNVIGEYSLYGVDNSVVERTRTGCYKIGTTLGNNGIAPVTEEEILDDEIFSTLEEYQSGTWSNQELICGPMVEMKQDNRYTVKDENGNKSIVDIPEDISGWVKIIVEVYKQNGVEQSKENYNSPVDGTAVYGSGFDEDTWEYKSGYYSQKYKPTYGDPEVYEVTSFARDQWPVIREQGIHRIRWKNCDNAGNCSDFKIIENIKIDTINPECQTTISYDNNLNSDGEYGPNHNGWLYDQQTARVSNACVDTSDLSKEDYFSAASTLYTQKDITQQLSWDDAVLSYNEVEDVSSGCSPTDPDTNAYTIYSEDIMTCSAGAKGIIVEDDETTYGVVRDLAGNVGYCTTGVTVKKDTTAPTCGTDVLYENTPNSYGWVNQGSITGVKYCNDAENAVTREDGTAIYSGCTFTDDADYQRETNDDYSFSVRVSSSYTGTAPISDYEYTGKNGSNYKVFYPTNRSSRTLKDKDILGPMSAEPDNDRQIISFDDYIRNDEGDYVLDSNLNKQTMTFIIEGDVMRQGYVVDRAGNISETVCNKRMVGKDTVPPECNNTAELIGDDPAYLEEKGLNSLLWHTSGRGIDWAGSNGPNGYKELVVVFRDCDDTLTYNYTESPYFDQTTTDYISREDLIQYYGQLVHPPYANKFASGCNPQYLKSVEENRWIYGDAVNIHTNRITTGERNSGGNTWNGPDNYDPMGTVGDVAGNVSPYQCEAVDIHIDYTPPTCDIYFTEGGMANYIEDGEPITYLKYVEDQRAYVREVNEKFQTKYHNTWTGFNVFATVKCIKDNNNGSGCIINGLRLPKTYLYNKGIWVEDTFTYDEDFSVGTDRNITTELYTTDYAENAKKCEKTFRLKQDLRYPEAQCSFTASYSRDNQLDSYLTVTINNVEDIKDGIDNIAVGVRYVDTDTTDFANANWNISNVYDENGYSNLCSGSIGCLWPGVKAINETGDPDDYRIVKFGEYLSTSYRQTYGAASLGTLKTVLMVQGHTNYEEQLSAYVLTNIYEYDSTNGDTMIDLTPGMASFTSKLFCGLIKQQVHPYIIVTDKVGNRSLTPCTGTPIVIPGCCDKTTDEEICGRWESKPCTKLCDTGEKWDEAACQNTSYYSGTTCYYPKRKNYEQCNTTPCCSQTESELQNFCNTASENPCDSGYQQTIIRSTINGKICERADDYVMCTGELNGSGNYCKTIPGVEGVEEEPGDITPADGTCRLRIKSYTGSRDIIELEGYDYSSYSDNDHCKIINVSPGDSNCTVYRYRTKKETTIRIDAFREAEKTRHFKFSEMPCDLIVYWGSSYYNFEKNPRAATTTYMIEKIYDEQKQKYKFCIYNDHYGDDDDEKCVWRIQ